jgi:hypothetical protein
MLQELGGARAGSRSRATKLMRRKSSWRVAAHSNVTPQNCNRIGHWVHADAARVSTAMWLKFKTCNATFLHPHVLPSLFSTQKDVGGHHEKDIC